jgi:pimeloyl-ACP methyl ester carboxylesterase
LSSSSAHLVGHSYGGVVSLLAAARRPEAVRSLTVIEAPAFAVAAGEPAVDAFVADITQLWAHGPDDPAAFLAAFLRLVGSRHSPPEPLSPELERGARLLMAERGPWEAAIPLDALASTTFPKLVVSGAHHDAFDAVGDVLEARLGAERAAIRARGTAPSAPARRSTTGWKRFWRRRKPGGHLARRRPATTMKAWGGSRSGSSSLPSSC